MVSFDKKVLFVGYGAVAQCTLPILFKYIKVRSRTSRSWTSKTAAKPSSPG